AGQTDEWNQADPASEFYQYYVQEYHAERLMLGTAAIQPYNSKGLIATLPLLNWNRANISGVNSDYYINQIDSAGIMNTHYPEKAARTIFAKNIVSTAFQTALQLSITGVVKDNSNNSKHFLESFTGKLGNGDQYSGSDTSARFMIRVQQNNSKSIANSRILEGWDDEIGHINADYSHLTDRDHYPLYAWGSSGEFGRTFWDTSDDGTTQGNNVLWVNDGGDFSSLRDPFSSISENRQYTHPLYFSQRTFNTLGNYGDPSQSVFNTQLPKCDQEFYPRYDDNSSYQSGMSCLNPHFYSPQWFTMDLDTLINGVDIGRNIIIPISEMDQDESPSLIGFDDKDGDGVQDNGEKDKVVDYNFPDMFDRFNNYANDDYFENGGLSYNQTNLQTNWDARADQLGSWAYPIQYLTLENIAIRGSRGDFFTVNMTNGDDSWIYQTNLGSESWIVSQPNGEVPTTHISIGSLEDNEVTGSGSSVTQNIWQTFNIGNQKTTEYLDYVTDSTIFRDSYL
ncbi:hypothetical protein LCGC14_2471610, partial [marine sediment metagenome]